MIDIKALRENPTYFQEASLAKNVTIDVDKILDLDQKARSLNSDLESIAAQKNEASKRIATSEGEVRNQLIKEMRDIDTKVEGLKAEYTPIKDELDALLHRIPNPALADVTVSPNETDNEVIRTVGEKTVFDFEPKDHLTLGENLGIIDVERAAKTSGARFTYLKGDGALLQFALVQYALNTVMESGFTPIVVPHMIKAEAMQSMGYLEHGGHDEIYYLSKDNLYLIGTSEQSIGPMHANEVLPADQLPLRYVGISSCYRREAGSYGKDTKGILRVHQFDKVEMFSFTKPENSEAEHELILSLEEKLM